MLGPSAKCDDGACFLGMVRVFKIQNPSAGWKVDMDMGQDTNMDYGGQGFLPKTAFSLVLPSPLVAILPNE